LIKTGYLKDGIADLGHAIALNGKDANAILVRAVAYFRHSEYEKAVRDFERVGRLDDKLLARESIDYGLSLNNLQRYADALNVFNKSDYSWPRFTILP
jgi:tetratricopeptide (TPR) repeat protein